jgi:hypothetical protein
MPQASDYLRARMLERFGDAIDDQKPWKFLEDRGYTSPHFIIRPPLGHAVTEDESECIDFLYDEWDWDFQPAPKGTNHD